MLKYGENLDDTIMEEIELFHPNLSEKQLSKIRKSLWKIYDGILCHNGELSKTDFLPDIAKTEKDYDRDLKACNIIHKHENVITSATVEGCLIRPADIISYFAQDTMDGLKEGIIDDLSQDYIAVINELGISTEELNHYLAKKDYAGLARRLENSAIKAVIDNSDKNCIRVPESMAALVYKQRVLNNQNIVNHKVTRPTEKATFPFAIRVLMNSYSKIVLDNIDSLPTANDSSDFSFELSEKYKNTPHLPFVEYLGKMNPEHYKLLQEIAEDSVEPNVREEVMAAINFLATNSTPEYNEKLRTKNSRILNIIRDLKEQFPYGISTNDPEQYINSLVQDIKSGRNTTYLGIQERMATKLSSWYIGEMNDAEFIRTLVDNSLVTAKELEDLNKKFIDIDYNQDTENALPEDWIKTMAEQAAATAKIVEQAKNGSRRKRDGIALDDK